MDMLKCCRMIFTINEFDTLLPRITRKVSCSTKPVYWVGHGQYIVLTAFPTQLLGS